MKQFILIFCSVACALVCFARPDAPKYTIQNRFSVEGDGGWDYLACDENTGRLFISHGMVTQVVDNKTGKLLGTIKDTKGVHGIAFDQNANKAFISCGRDSSVIIVNFTTLEFIAKVNVTGTNPDAIVYDAFSGNVFVYNGRSSNATVIDPKTNTVIATITLPGKPEYSVSDGKGKVYVNIEDKNLLCAINSKTMKLDNSWSLAPGEEPSGLALDNVNHRLFSVCGNKKMIVTNALTGKKICSLDIGEGTDGCAFDPALQRAYSSNGDGTLTVIQEEKGDIFKVLESIPTAKGARTLCVDSKTHHIFLPMAEYLPAPKSAENAHPRPTIKQGTFTILDIAP